MSIAARTYALVDGFYTYANGTRISEETKGRWNSDHRGRAYYEHVPAVVEHTFAKGDIVRYATSTKAYVVDFVFPQGVCIAPVERVAGRSGYRTEQYFGLGRLVKVS